MRTVIALFTTGVALSLGCTPGHTASIATHELPPLPTAAVVHQSRLWIDLPHEMSEAQCVAYEGYQNLCFQRLREGLALSLERLLWPSFPSVKLREHGDELKPGDYLLQVEAGIDALPPDEQHVGWSAVLSGRWRLVRDGMPVNSETVSSRSRGDFAYGSGLGIAGGEVVDAVAAHIASVLVSMPETERIEPVPLPPVAAADALVLDTQDEEQEPNLADKQPEVGDKQADGAAAEQVPRARPSRAKQK